VYLEELEGFLIERVNLDLDSMEAQVWQVVVVEGPQLQQGRY